MGYNTYTKNIVLVVTTHTNTVLVFHWLSIYHIDFISTKPTPDIVKIIMLELISVPTNN